MLININLCIVNIYCMLPLYIRGHPVKCLSQLHYCQYGITGREASRSMPTDC